MFVDNGLIFCHPSCLILIRFVAGSPQPFVGILLLVKQRIDVLNGIAWDNKTARLFGE
jgi:hypothetical protein